MLLANAVGSLLLASGPLACTVLPTEGRVIVSITPGKPNAPTETVTVSWRDGRGSLRSERRAASGEVLAAGEANLGEGQLRELWQTVQRRHLTTFTPREAGGQTFDFGERRVRLEWVSRAGKAREAHDFSWIAPLENEADVRPLQRAAATAARGTVPGVLLAYFPN
jgi:hypothetical protein